MSESDTLTVAGDPGAKLSARARAGTFCVRLWQHMRIDASGQSRVCCAYTGDYVAQAGKAVSTNRQSLMDIWNADTMRELRRDMVAGRRVAGCEVCYLAEDRGGESIRTHDNLAWEQGWMNEQRVTIDNMMAQAVDSDFHLPKLPAIIEVETGNLCNLKCRTCNSFSSSKIALDPVHRKWDGVKYSPHAVPEVEIDPGRIRRVGPIERLVDELATDSGSEIKRLYFFGGETFLVREIPALLDLLVAAGRAPMLSLLFITNGTVVPEWLSLAAQFHRIDLAISVDGYANDFEYIRFPARWAKLTHNLPLFKQIPNVFPQVTTTIQVNNVLGLTRLFRYLDFVKLGFAGYLLDHPHHLAVGALPASIRRLAGARLRDYAADDCRPEHRGLVLSFAAQIEEAGAEAGNPVLLRDFMLFTNDLDATRGQSIHRTDPELVTLLEQAGYPWIHEHLHTPPDAAGRETQPSAPEPMDAYDANTTLQRELGATVKSLRDELLQTRDRLRTAEDQATIREDEARARDEAARLREQAAAIREQQAASLREEETKLRDEEARLRDEEAGRVRQELSRVCLAFDQLRLAFDQLRREFDELHASRSWRMTRPLRAAGRMLRRRLPGGPPPGVADTSAS